MFNILTFPIFFEEYVIVNIPFRSGRVLAYLPHSAGQRGGVAVSSHAADVTLAALAVLARVALAAQTLAHAAARRYHVCNEHVT